MYIYQAGRIKLIIQAKTQVIALRKLKRLLRQRIGYPSIEKWRFKAYLFNNEGVYTLC